MVVVVNQFVLCIMGDWLMDIVDVVMMIIMKMEEVKLVFVCVMCELQVMVVGMGKEVDEIMEVVWEKWWEE